MSFLNPNRPISWNLPCRRCQYNLRGLPRNGRCPECNEHILESVRASLGELRKGEEKRSDWIDLLCRYLVLATFLLGALAGVIIVGTFLLQRLLGGVR